MCVCFVDNWSLGKVVVDLVKSLGLEAEGSGVFCGGDVGRITYTRLRANLTIRPEDVKKKKKRGVGFLCVSLECVVVFVGIERELPQRGRESLFVCVYVCVCR